MIRFGKTALFAGLCFLGAGQSLAQAPPNLANEWPTYGHDAGGMRFSPLKQITPANVGSLGVGWVYHLKPEGYVAVARRGPGGGPGGPFAGGPSGGPPAAGPAGAPPAGAPVNAQAAQAAAEGIAPNRATTFLESEVTPLVIDGLMYIASPYGRVVALDSATGKEKWVHVLASGNPATRGVEYFPGDKTTPPLIVVTTTDAKLFTLDPKTGAVNTKFGDNGYVNLNTPEITYGLPTASNGLSSPAIMYNNLIILGGRTQEQGGPGPAGDARAFDIHTGKLAWTFHSIPQKGEPNFGTWAGDSAKQRSGANVWGLMTVDAKRGVVYMPFGAPSGDAYGGDRPGDNLYSSSVVAADAKTGKYLWHFQVVHHDIWDFDLETAPILMDVKRAGRAIPAVAVINKNALLFLLDRTDGKPIYGVEERPVPKSDVPFEVTSPTQPFPVKPAPLARQTFTMDEIAKVTPELEAACRKLIADNNILIGGGPFSPITYNRVRLNFPSSIGGPNWGGASFDPTLGYFFVNVSEIGQLQGLKDPASGPVNGEGLVGSNRPAGRAGQFANMTPGGRFKDNASNMMCTQPPWGSMVAVNVNTGDIAWKAPLGVTDSLPADKRMTGRPSMGGSIATAGGLVFVGATDDARFRAFDSKTGKEVWTVKLDAAANSVPSTYLGKDGRQYVVVTGTGNSFVQAPSTSDAITAFTLK
jgi:quinoprotein glucose dehydrogenase